MPCGCATAHEQTESIGCNQQRRCSACCTLRQAEPCLKQQRILSLLHWEPRRASSSSGALSGSTGINSRCVRRDQGPTPDGVADDYAAADGGHFAAGQITARLAPMAGQEICVVLVCVWEDHGVVSRVPGLHRAHVSAALKANSDAHSDRQRGSNSWTGDLCCPCWRVGGPRRCQRCRCQCCRRCQEQEREQMQVLLQARAVLWIGVVTSCGHARASVGGTGKTFLRG